MDTVRKKQLLVILCVLVIFFTGFNVGNFTAKQRFLRDATEMNQEYNASLVKNSIEQSRTCTDRLNFTAITYERQIMQQRVEAFKKEVEIYDRITEDLTNAIAANQFHKR